MLLVEKSSIKSKKIIYFDKAWKKQPILIFISVEKK